MTKLSVSWVIALSLWSSSSRLRFFVEVTPGEKILHSGTVPESYFTEYIWDMKIRRHFLKHVDARNAGDEAGDAAEGLPADRGAQVPGTFYPIIDGCGRLEDRQNP